MDNNIPGDDLGSCEFQFLKLLAEEIERGEYPPGSTFKRESQLYVFRRFRILFGPIYSDRYLKSRLKKIKQKYHEFSELLNQEGIYWNTNHNVVYGNSELLNEKYRGRYANGVYHGEPNFDLMCQVFETGINFK